MLRRLFCHMMGPGPGRCRGWGRRGDQQRALAFSAHGLFPVSLVFPVLFSGPVCKDPLESCLSLGCRALATQSPLLFLSLPASFCSYSWYFPSHAGALEMYLEGLMQAPLTTHLQEAQQPMDAFVPPHAACCWDGSLTLCPGPWASEWGPKRPGSVSVQF